jgi:hypothetical protein
VQNKLDVEAAMDPGGPVSIKGVNPWFSAHVRLPLLLSSLFLGTRGEHSTFPSTKKKKENSSPRKKPSKPTFPILSWIYFLF